MIEPRQVAAGVVGGVDWQSAVSGLCRCPGESLHTHKTNNKDCRVCVGWRADDLLLSFLVRGGGSRRQP